MERFECAYLDGHVELTDERRAHIIRYHPELSEKLDELIAATLARPDEVRSDTRYASTRLISAFFPPFLDGKHIVVAVVSDPPLSSGAKPRHWIVTAYPARELTQGVTEWKAD